MSDGPWTRYGGGSAAPVQAAPRRAPRPSMPQIRFVSDEDALARTLIGEAGDEDDAGQVAVGAVALNRSRHRGLTPTQVVLERNQFEPWGNPETTRRLLSISPESPEYQRALANARRALAGEDPTQGASHFYSPTAQAAMGRRPPSWDDGSGVDLGRHRFFRIEGSPQSAPQDVQQTSAPAGEGPWARYAAPATQTASTTPQEVIIDQGVYRDGDRAIGPNGEDLGEWGEFITRRDRDNEENRARVEREADPEYQQDYAESKARIENVPAWMLNMTQGGTLGSMDEVLGFLDKGQATRDAVRDRESALMAEDPTGTFAAQFAGGLLTPGLKGTGDFIAAGTGANRIARAAAVSGGYGAASGIMGAEGNLIERAPEGLLSAAIAAPTGGLLDSALTRETSRLATRNAAGPSAARRLSRQGVELTPGQAAGGAWRRIEDGLTSIPFMGDSIKRAQRDGLLSFDNVATNTALEPIGGGLLDTAGRQGVRNADSLISNAYTTALEGASASADDVFEQAVTNAVRPDGLPESILTNLNAVVDDVLTPLRNGALDGQTWKQVDSQLAADIRAADRAAANAPEQRLLRDRLQEVRTAYRDLFGRVNGDDALNSVNSADRASAQYRLVRDASADVASAGRGGNSSPATLNRAVVASAGKRQAARGEGLLQDLTDDAMEVLPSTVPDSGTPLRGLLTAVGAGGGATMIGANPAAVVAGVAGLAAGSAAYSRPAIRLFNQVYRALDAGDAGRATTVLAEIEKLAGRHPALKPYYEAAVLHVLGGSQNQSPDTAPAGGGLLSPTAP